MTKETDIQPGASARSAELQGIIDHMPGWLSKWGIALTIGLMMIIAIAAAVISYPETANIAVTLYPAATIKTKAGGSHTDSIMVTVRIDNNPHIKLAKGQSISFTADERQTVKSSFGGVIAFITPPSATAPGSLTMRIPEKLHPSYQAPTKGTCTIILKRQSLLQLIADNFKLLSQSRHQSEATYKDSK